MFFQVILVLSVLAFFPMAWLGFTLPKLFLAQAGLAVVACALHRRGQRVDFRSTHLWVGLYAGFLLLATVFSPAPILSFFGISETLFGFSTQWTCLAAFVLAVFFVSQKSWNWRWLQVLNFVVVTYALIQWIGLDPLEFFWNTDAFLHRSFSVLGNPNWLAGFLVLTAPVAICSLKGKASWIFLGLNSLALLSTASKAGFLAAIFVAIGLGLGANFNLKNRWKWLVGFLLFAILAGLSLWHFYPDSWSLFRSSGARLLMAESAGLAFLDQAWGHGLALFSYAVAPFTGTALWVNESLGAQVAHPHNFILERLVETGPIGLIFYGFVLWKILVPNLRKKGMDAAVAWACLGYFVTLLFGFEIFPNELLLWVFLAFLSRKMGTNFRQSSRRFFAVLAVLLTFFSVLSATHLWANFSYEKAHQSKEKGNLVEAVNALEKATQRFPFDRIHLLESAELLMALQPTPPGALDRVEFHLNRLETLSGGLDPDLPALKAWLAAKRGDSELAREQLELALQQNPSSIHVYEIGFQVYTELGEEDLRQALVDQFRAALPNFWNRPETEAGRIFQKNHPWVEEWLGD